MKKNILLLYCLLISALAFGQNFTEAPFQDPAKLLEDLKYIASRTISPQMDSVWSVFESTGYNGLSEEQKDLTFKVCKSMNHQGFRPIPHFESLMACLSSKELNDVQKNQFLSVMDTSLLLYKPEVTANFLGIARSFLESRMLEKYRYNNLAVEGGSFSFKHIEDYDNIVEKKEPLPVVDTTALVVEEKSEWFDHLEKEKEKEVDKPKTDDDDGWGSDDDDDDGWGSDDDDDDDGWGSDDDDSSGDDGWGSDDDSSDDDGWGSSDDDDSGWDDGWASDDDGWGSDEETPEEKKKREEEEKKKAEEERKRKAEEERLRRMIKNPTAPTIAKMLPDVGDIPELKGPMIEVNEVTLVIQTVYDTFKIANTSGAIMGNKVFVGKGGRVDWSSIGIPSSELYGELSEYKFNVKSPVLQAGDVTLTYPAKVDSTVKGEFRYMSRPVNKYSPAVFPRFISYNNDVVVKDVATDVTYEGGLMLKGKDFYSASLLQGPSSIIVTKNGVRKFKATSRSPFMLTDTIIENLQTELIVYQQEDSLMHPAMKLRYYPKSGRLKARKDKHAYKEAPFIHSYHNVEMRGDYLSWDVDSDSIDLKMLNKKIPFTVESKDYFDVQRFARLKGLSRFHPLVTVVGYRAEVRSNGFYSANLAAHYNLNPKLIKGAMRWLQQRGFIDYDNATDWVTVKRKAVHYTKANLGRADYDNIIIRSLVDSSQNMTFNVAENDLLVRGVEGFMISDSLRVIVTPTNKEITIKENRNTEFTGKMKAGKFIFEGSDFLFNYDSFIVRMDEIDRLAFLVPDSITGELIELPNAMVDTEGVLFISQPNNKSGLLPHKDFPRFDTGNGGTFFFGGDEILDGAYKGDTSIYFDVPPFFIDSINSSDPASINFNGSFISGGIFPEFKQNLVVMPDRSFGFIRNTPTEGFPLYEAKLTESATYYNKISLDNRGIRGNGFIEYLNGQFYSPDFIFYTDSVITTRGANMKIDPGNYKSSSYPSVDIDQYSMRWLISSDSMLLTNPPDKPFRVYEIGAGFDGTLAMSSKNLYGTGEFENDASLTNSKEFFFNETDFTSRHSTFRIKSTDPNKPALLGERVKVFFNLAESYADITAERERDEIFSFPYMQYRTNLSQGHWDFNEKTVRVDAAGGNEKQFYKFVSTNIDQKGLEFDAKSAIYDISDVTLNIDGVEGINAMNSRIIPNEGKVVVRENADMDVLQNSTILMNSFSKYHTLTDANVKIRSRDKFEGDGIYTYFNENNDTTLVRFDYFSMTANYEKRRNRIDTSFTTTAAAIVKEDNKMKIMPGILYKGNMKLVDSKRTPEFDGLVSLDLPREDNAWFAYTSNSPDTLSGIYINDDMKVAGVAGYAKLTTGLYLQRKEKGLYGSMLEFKRERVNDLTIFAGSGKLVYNASTQKYTVAPIAKLNGETLIGNKFTYDHDSQSIHFDGIFNILENPRNVIVRCSGIGNGNVGRSEFFINTFLALEFEHDPSPFAFMLSDLVEETEGANASQAQLEIKLAQFIEPKAFSKYKRDLYSEDPETIADLMPTSMVFSDINLQWSEEHKAFHSVGEIGISNIFKEELDIIVSGYVEIPKIEDNNILHIYLETSNRAWYYIGYRKGDIEVYSSNETFNIAISNKSAKSKVKLADAEAISLFLEDFSHKYHGGEYINEVDTPDKKEKKKEETEKKDGF